MKGEDKIQELDNLLKRFLHNQEDIDEWLSFPHPSLGGRTPKEVIESGHIGAVITIISNALIGIPS